MFRNRDFGEPRQPESGESELIRDLELGHLFEVMAGGDAFVFEVVRTAFLSSICDPDTIRYRQSVLRDCLNNPEAVKEVYDLAVEAIVREKKDFWRFTRNDPRWVLTRSRNVLEMFFGLLTKLRRIADDSADKFESEALLRFLAMLRAELSDHYLGVLQAHLRQLALSYCQKLWIEDA
jgi:hypothetical protein